jgi:hypothetical protein
VFVDVAGAGDEQPQARAVRGEQPEGTQQDLEALARLVHPAQEPDRAARARPAVEGFGVQVAARGDPVGDQHGVAAQVLDERRPGRFGDRDPAVDLLKRRAEHGLGGEQPPGLAHRGVHRRHDGAGGYPAGEQRQRGHRGLMHVQHVEVAVAQPAADPVRRQRAECQPGHRPVVRDRHRLAGRDHVGRERPVVVGRGDHRDLVAELDQRLGQVPDVLLYPAGHVPRVRARDAYPHGRASWGVMRWIRWLGPSRWRGRSR